LLFKIIIYICKKTITNKRILYIDRPISQLKTKTIPMKALLFLILLLPLTVFSGVTRLRDGYCDDTLLSLNSPIYAKIATGADAYKFQFYNPNTGQTFEYEKNTGTVYAITLGYPELIPYAFYNTTYEVRVKVRIGGVWESTWGVMCRLTTPVGTKVIDSDNGKVVNLMLYELIRLEPCNLPGVQDYQVRYRLNGTTGPYYTATMGTEATASSTDREFEIADFNNPLLYNRILRISARVLVNGVWSGWGNERIVSVVRYPKTKLCDGTYLTTVGYINNCGTLSSPFIISSTSAILSSYNVYGFTSYTFEVCKLDGSGNIVETQLHTRLRSAFGSMARSLKLNMISSYASGVNNTTFRIRIKTNLGDWGDPCYVRVQNNYPIKPDVIASPNPFTSKFAVNVDSVNVEIYNMNGQLLETQSRSTELGEYLPTGIYFIKVGDDVIKVIKE